GTRQKDVQDSSWIEILPEYSVSIDETRLSQLIDFIYDDTTPKTPTAGALHEKATACPKNNTTDTVNAKILSNTKGQSKTYLGTMLQNTIASLIIGQPNTILEAKVYQKWISKSISEMKELAFCCILIDKETLENKISLKFGKTTTFDVLQGQESEFLEHHFELVAYNQLASRVPYRDEN
nr:DNA helicase [Tanacetum cinerariifolium]